MFEFLAKVFVQPRVQEGVVAARRHCHAVSQEEQQVEVGAYVDEIVDHVDQVQGKPTDAEDGDHGDEHPVGAPFLFAIGLFLPGALRARLGPSPLVETP